MVEDRRKRGPNRRLDSWKEIASYFGRDERTVKRWEKERGLPVRRLPGAHGGVYAFTDDLAQWMATRRQANSSSEQSVSSEDPAVSGGLVAGPPSGATDTGDVRGQPIVSDSRAGQMEQVRSGKNRRAWVLAAALLPALVAIVVLLNQKRVLASLGKQKSGGATLAANHHVPNPVAQDLYLKGRYYWNKRTSADLNKALDYFTQAIVSDPNYALAYVGMADCYNLLREYSVMPEEEAYPRAMAAARKALELDNSLAEAHNSLAFGTYYWSLDAAGAEQEFREALRLNPNCALAHHWYATFLVSIGRNQDALQQIEIAQQLDSSSTAILADKALILYYSGRTDDAVVLLNQINATEPSFLSTHRYLAIIDLMRRDYAAYLAESRKAAQLSQNETDLSVLNAAEKGFHAGGQQAMLESMLLEQKKLLAEGRTTAYRLAETCALMGHNKEAFGYLRMARERHESPLSGIRVDPTLANLHADPSYREFVSQLGLSQTAGS